MRATRQLHYQRNHHPVHWKIRGNDVRVTHLMGELCGAISYVSSLTFCGHIKCPKSRWILYRCFSPFPCLSAFKIECWLFDMAPARKILFLTNSELGQCNVAFAVAEEFLRRGEFDVHIGSYSSLAGLVEELNKRVNFSRSVEFHEIPGPSMTDLAIRSNIGLLFHRPGVKGAARGFQKVATAMKNWRPSEYHAAYKSCLAMIDKLSPDIVMVDPILHVGLDACRTAKARVAILWPVPLKDVVIAIQPNGGIFWKYPVYASPSY